MAVPRVAWKIISTIFNPSYEWWLKILCHYQSVVTSNKVQTNVRSSVQLLLTGSAHQQHRIEKVRRRVASSRAGIGSDGLFPTEWKTSHAHEIVFPRMRFLVLSVISSGRPVTTTILMVSSIYLCCTIEVNYKCDLTNLGDITTLLQVIKTTCR